MGQLQAATQTGLPGGRAMGRLQTRRVGTGPVPGVFPSLTHLEAVLWEDEGFQSRGSNHFQQGLLIPFPTEFNLPCGEELLEPGDWIPLPHVGEQT